MHITLRKNKNELEKYFQLVDVPFTFALGSTPSHVPGD